MKVLWLASWYPNKINPTNGDFIQRHAKAVSLFCKVDVIHVEGVPFNSISKNLTIQTTQSENLTETIALYKKSKLSVVGKIISFIQYKKLFKNLVIDYIKKNGKPNVVHVHVAMKAGLIALWIKEKFKIDFIVTEHWSLFVNNPFNSFKNKSFLFKNTSIKVFKNAALVLPVNKKLGDAIDIITSVRFTVIYNCVNTNYFFYNESNAIKNFTFIHVSTLDENKNPQSIIDAFISFNQLHPNSNLIIVGKVTASLSKFLSKQKIPVNAIQFTGLISYEKVAQLMQQSNSLILFSQTENMPCVILEALCCGLPVITSNVGGIDEVINKENGLFVPEYTSQSLFETMIKMYESYHSYNKKKIANDAKANFVYDVIGKEIFFKYKEITNSKFQNLN